MATRKTFDGKHAGNPHVGFNVVESAQSATQRRGVLGKMRIAISAAKLGLVMLTCFCVTFAFANNCHNTYDDGHIKWKLSASMAAGTGQEVRDAVLAQGAYAATYSDAFTFDSYTNITLTGLTYSNADEVKNLRIPQVIKWDTGGNEGKLDGWLRNINSSAISGSDDIVTVALPYSIKKIGIPCFKGCSKLTSIKVLSVNPAVGAWSDAADAAHEVGETDVVMVAGKTSYITKDGVLYNKDKTVLLKYPEGKEGDFFVVPETVTELAPYCFANTKLAAVQFLGDCPKVDSTSFSGSSCVVYRYSEAEGWPETVTSGHYDYRVSIARPAYWNGIYVYRIPKSGTTKEGDFFSKYDVFYEIANGVLFGFTKSSDKAKICYVPTETRGELQVPSTLGGVTVAEIGYHAFWCCSKLTSVTIPNTVTNIGYQAFHQCYKMSNVTIPDSVTSIDESAFSQCEGLADEDGFVIVRDVLYYYYGENHKDKTEVVIPQNVKSIGREAFWPWGRYLTNITIPNSVTHIGSFAFNECTNLTSITIPPRVTYIGDQAFNLCSSLSEIHILDIEAWCNIQFGESQVVGQDSRLGNLHHNLYLNGRLISDLTIPHGVSSIGICAFQGCTELKKITIPETVTNIPSGAFSYLSKLEEIVVDSGNPKYKSVDGLLLTRGYFSYKTGCDMCVVAGVNGDVIIPYEVSQIGESAFAGLSGLTSVVFPNSVWIHDDAFRDCSGLTNVTIPSGRIGDSAFYGCSGLTKVIIGASDVRGGAFASCTNLKKAVFTSSHSIGNSVFSACDSLTDILFWGDAPGCNNYSFYNSSDFIVRVRNGSTGWDTDIPGTWKGHRIEYIDESELVTCIVSFNANGGVGAMQPQIFTEDILQALVANQFSYEGHTFDGWATNAAGSVVYEDGQVIAVYSDMTLYAHWTENGGGSGGGDEPAPSGPDFSIEDGVLTKVVLNDATEVVVPAEVTSIGEGAFRGLGLMKLTIGGGVTNVHVEAFDDCGSLVEIAVASGNPAFCSKNGMLLTKDGKTLVQGVNGDVVVPSGVAVIGDSAFYGCSGLKSVTIPDSVTSIEYYAFDHCDSLARIVVDSGNPAFCSKNGMLLTKDGKTLVQGVNGDVVVPSGVAVIGDSAFYGCSGLKSVTIPDSVTTIEGYAFGDCDGLKDVSIPGSVTNIGPGAFCYCDWIESVRFCGDAPELGPYVFCEVPSDCVVYVAKGSTGWGVDIPGTWNDLRIEYNQDVLPTYTVAYKPGAKGAGSQQTATKTHDVVLILKGAVFTRTGYTQTGWATSDGGAKAYNLGASYKSNAAITLYPFWTANTYTLRLHRNNSSGDGATAGRSLTYDKARALPKIADELKWAPRSGYTFLGWATSASATSAKYTDGQSVKNLSTSQDATVHLYAVWKKNDPTPQFTFGGDAVWTKQSDGSWKSGKVGDYGSTYASMKVTGPGTISFKWKTSSEINYDKLHFYVNGSEPVAAISGIMDSWASVSYNVTASGSVTLKWEYEKDVSAYVGSDCGWIKDVAWTSTASANTYILRLHRNNSERDGATAGRTYTIGKARALPKATTELKWAPRTGYDFLGWARSATATTATYTDGQSLKDLTTTAGAEVHLYAVWKAHKYIVRLHRNNSKNDGATTGRAFDYDQVRFLPTMAELKWVRSGYMFLGWSQAQSSTTVKYADGLNVFNLSANDGEELHVWGVWKKAEANAYLLRLHRNNSERDGATAGRQLKLNKSRNLPTVKELNWTRSGYMFKGWATTSKNAAAGKVTYKDGATITSNLVSTPGDTAHLYAVWQ